MDQKTIDCHPLNRFCGENVSNIMLQRISNMPIEERLDVISMSQMFSFWSEIQNALIAASQEIKALKEKIKELENKKCQNT